MLQIDLHFLVPENTAAKKIYLRNAVMVVIIRGMRGPTKGGVGGGGSGGFYLPPPFPGSFKVL